MTKRPFLTFIAVVGTLILSLLWFLESPQFVHVLKVVASRYIPSNIGIQADFSELSIKFFPPGFSIKDPRISIGKRNIANLPAGSSVSAEKIDFRFQLFQTLSGDIRVNELSVVNGRVQVVIEEEAKKTSKKASSKASHFDFHWDELFHIRAEAIRFQNVLFSVKVGDSESPALEVDATELKLAQWTGKGGLGYLIHLDLRTTKGSYLKNLSLPDSISKIQGEAYVNALGLNLDSLSISMKGMDASVSGQIKGNLREQKDLWVDASAKIKANFKEVVSGFGSGSGLSPSLLARLRDLGGGLSFSGKVQGNLRELKETLKLEGLVNIRNLSYQQWNAELFQAEAKWTSSPTGGEVSLVKASLVSPEIPRRGGNQPGSGGRIEVGPVRWEVGSNQPVSVPLHFEHAHLHWLAAPVVKKVYGLDFRLNGNILAKFGEDNHGRWELASQLDSWLELFQLDNQRYRQEKPLTTVFKIPRMDLNGLVVINSSGIFVNDAILGLPNSKIHAKGKVDFKSGYDLYASSQMIRLADVGQIAENTIKGSGTLNAHIHGVSAQTLVDLDVDLKDAYYLNLFLGGVKGRITWDDDPSHLLFSHVQVTHENTGCSLNGVLDVSKANTVDLNVKFNEGNIQDLIQIFGNLTKPLGWFPHELNGPVRGDIKISGGIAFNQLKILSNLHGTNWELFGERFKEVLLTGGYDGGAYFISDGKILKRSGKVVGKIRVSADRKLDWSFSSENFTVGDVDHIAKLDVPIRGSLDFETVGTGVEGSIGSVTQVNLKDFSVRGVAMAPSQLEVRTQKGVVKIEGTALGGQGNIEAVYDSNPKEMSSVQLELKQLDFSPILLLLNTKSIQDRSLVGRMTGLLNLSFHSGQVERASGKMAISEYVLARQDTAFKLDSPVYASITDGNFEVSGLKIKGEEGSIAIDMKNRNNVLEGNISGELDTSIMEFFVPSIVQAQGTSTVDLSVGGNIKSPTLFGRLQFEGNSLRISSLESAFENVSGTLQLRQNILAFQKIQADLGGGRVTADGRIVVNSDRYPSVFLKGTVKKSKIKVYPFQYVTVSGDLDVHGEEVPYIIGGNIVVDSALSKEKILSQKASGGGLKALQYAPPPSLQGESNYPKFKLNVAVEAEKDVVIQNDLFRDVQVKGSLTLVNTLDAPRVLGIAEITQGKLVFKNNVFVIQSAKANFDSPNVINPSFDLNANSEVNGVKIRMYATGRPDKIKVEFTSNPAMQESEILSLLTVGLTSNDTKRLNASDQSLVRQGEAASLVLHSLDFNREVEEKTGFKVQLDESFNPQQGTSAFRPSSQTDSTAAPQITIRRKLGDRLNLSAGSTVGAGTNKSNQVNVDYSINKDISVTGIFNNYGNTGATDVQSSTQATQNSYGLDLKFQKRFK